MIKTYNLNLIPGGFVVIYANQGDYGETITFNLKLNGEDYTPSGSAIVQGMSKGMSFTHDATISGSTVSFTLNRDMTLYEGDTVAQIVLTEGTNRTGTQYFILRIQRATYDSTGI